MKGATSAARPKRLMVLDPASGFGGHQAMTLKLAEVLLAGERVGSLVFLHGGSMDGQEARPAFAGRNVAFHRFSPPRRDGLIGSLLDLPRLVRTAAMVRNLAPDRILAVPGGLEASSFPILAGLLAGFRIAVYLPMIHSLRLQGARFPEPRDRLARQILSFASRVVVIADAQARELAAHGLGRISVVRNPVVPGTDPASRREALPERPAIVVAGRLDRIQKGQDRLIEFLARNRDLTRACRFIVVGDGPDGAMLRTRAEALEVPLEFRPWTSDWPAFTDILLVPSRFEGVPLVILEGLSQGIPVVATPVGGCPDLLPPDWIFDPDRDDSWRAAISSASSRDRSFRASSLARDLAMRMNERTFQEEVNGMATTILG